MGSSSLCSKLARGLGFVSTSAGCEVSGLYGSVMDFWPTTWHQSEDNASHAVPGFLVVVAVGLGVLGEIVHCVIV